MDINKILFSRTVASKKIEIIENLTVTELLSITPDTISKMVKEAGTRLYKSRDKELRISYQRRTGNNWNSTVEGVRNFKGIPMLDLYVQYENTDTSTSVSLSDFMKNGDYRGSIARTDRYGNPRSYYFTYSVSDKARFLRQLLMEYVEVKYNLKCVED